MKYASILILFLLLTACRSQPEVTIPEEVFTLENLAHFSSDTEPLMEIELIPETVYGETDEVLLSSWIRVHVDSRGRVFIADVPERSIYLYNPDGTYNRQIGQSGGGPGEYQRIGLMRSDDNFFYHYNNRNLRLTRYDINTFDYVDDFELVVEHNDDDTFYRSVSSIFPIGSDNEILVLLRMQIGFDMQDVDLSQREIQGYMYNLETGELGNEQLFSFPASETLVHFEGGGFGTLPLPYQRKSVVRVNNGQIIYGWSEHFFFRYYDLNGNYQSALFYEYSNPRLNRREVLRMYENRSEPWRSIIQNDEMPDTWPSWDRFLPDDENRLWVERRTDNREKTEFHVLDESGELLAVFPWESGNSIQKIQNGYLYSLERNEDDLQELVKYRIEM